MDKGNIDEFVPVDSRFVTLPMDTIFTTNSFVLTGDGSSLLSNTADNVFDDGGSTIVSLPLQFVPDSHYRNIVFKNIDPAALGLVLDTGQFIVSGGKTEGNMVINTEDIDNDEVLPPGASAGGTVANFEMDFGNVTFSSLSDARDPLRISEETQESVLPCTQDQIQLLSENGEEITENFDVNILIQKLGRGPGRPKKDLDFDPPPGKGPYVCSICLEEYVNHAKYKKHMKTHKNDKPYICPICPSSFNVESNMILHIATHDKENLQCPECQAKFSRVASLKSHIMLHMKEESMFCTECGDEFATQSQLDDHKQEHDEEWIQHVKVYQCLQCRRKFPRVSAYRQHMKEHMRVKATFARRPQKRNIDRSHFSHGCIVCGKHFQKPSQLIRHNRIHTGERPYKCNVCNRAFNQKGSLQIHMSKHNGHRPFSCELCSATFSQRGNLRAHILRVHTIPPSGETVYRCMECACVFKKLGSLNAHVSRMHSSAKLTNEDNQAEGNSQESPVAQLKDVLKHLAELKADLGEGSESDILQQALVNSGLSEKSPEVGSNSYNAKTICAVKRDLLSAASGENTVNGILSVPSTLITLADKGSDGVMRRYIIRQRKVGRIRYHQCSYCNKEFKKPSDLVRHIRIHTHEKPFKCTSCFRSFAVKSTLKAHQRMHLGIKKHVCNICKHKFASSSSLHVHLRVHTGQKPFKCDHCTKVFRTIGNCRTHMLVHSKEKKLGPGPGRRKKPTEVSVKDKPPNNVPNIPLPEPLIVSETGVVQACPRNTNVYLPDGTMCAERPFKCAKCNAAFRRLCHLKQHIFSIHTTERPFSCSTCDKTFNAKSVLKAHERTHSGVRAYQCTQCSQYCSTQGSLRRHMSIHSELRPYMCPCCQKTFKTSVSCRKHMKTHTQDLALQVKQEQNNARINTIKEKDSMVITVTDASQLPIDTLGPDFTQLYSGQSFQIVKDSNSQNNKDPSVIDPLNLQISDIDNTDTVPNKAESISVYNIPQNRVKSTINLNDLRDPSVEVVRNKKKTATGSDFVDNNLTTRNPKDSSLHSSIDMQFTEHAGLTQENIREIERTLSEEIFGTVIESQNENSTEMSSVDKIISESMPNNLEEVTNKQLDTDGTTTAEQPSNNSQPHSNMFPSSFDQCVLSAISLQSDPLDLGDLTNTPNMATFLTSSCDNVDNLVISGNEPAQGESNTEPTEAAAEVAPVTDKSNKDTNGGFRLHRCRYCAASFKKLSHLKTHYIYHSKQKLYSCQVCGKKYATPSAVKIHMRSHTGERKFVCKVCNQTFALSCSLSRHMAVHDEKRPFKCFLCSDEFRTEEAMRSHLSLHAPRMNKDKVVVKHQPTSKGRRKDVIRLTEEETIVLAQQPISLAGSLSERVLIASAAEKDRISEVKDPEEKFQMEPMFPNRCKYCPKSFRKPSDLVRHIRIHTGERPFQCAHCSKCFTVKSTLDSHLKTHEGQKQFDCHVCGSQFSTKGSLKVHMRLHTGAKPFKCPVCENRFRTSGHRKAHILSHVKEAINSATGLANHSANKKHTRRKKKLQMLMESQQEETDEVNPSNNEQPVARITIDSSVLENLTQLQNANNGPLDLASLLNTTSLGEGGIVNTTNVIQDLPILNAETVPTKSVSAYKRLDNDIPVETSDINAPEDLEHDVLASNIGSTKNIRELDTSILGNKFTIQSLTNIDDETAIDLGSAGKIIVTSEGITGKKSRKEVPSGVKDCSSQNLQIFSSPNKSNEKSVLNSHKDFMSTSIGSKSNLLTLDSESARVLGLNIESANQEPLILTVDSEDDELDILNDKPSGKGRKQLCPEKGKKIFHSGKGGKLFYPQKGRENVHSGKVDKIFYSGKSGKNVYSGKARKSIYPHKNGKNKSISPSLISHDEVDSVLITNENGEEMIGKNFHSSNNFHTGKNMSLGPSSMLMNLHSANEMDGLHSSNLFNDDDDDVDENNKEHFMSDIDALKKMIPNLDSNQILTATSLQNVVSNLDSMGMVLSGFTPDQSMKNMDTIGHVVISLDSLGQVIGNLNTNNQNQNVDKSVEQSASNMNSGVQVVSSLDSQVIADLNSARANFNSARQIVSDLNALGHTNSSQQIVTNLNAIGQVINNLSSSGQIVTDIDSSALDSTGQLISNFNVVGPIMSNMDCTEQSAVGLNCEDQLLGHLNPTDHILTSFNPTGVLTALDPSGQFITVDSSGRLVTTLDSQARIISNFEMQLNDSLQLTSSDNVLVPQTLDESLMQQFSASNVVLNDSSETEKNMAEATHENLEGNGDIGSMRFEIHTDENGQIIKIEPINGDTTFDMSNSILLDGEQTQYSLEPNHFENASKQISKRPKKLLQNITRKPRAKKFRLSNSTKGGNSDLDAQETWMCEKSCEICGKSFIKPSQLVRHRRIHTGERPFQCVLCDKTFNQNNALNIHIKSHFGERPFQCQHCDMAFTQKGNLKTHIRRAHIFHSDKMTKTDISNTRKITFNSVENFVEII